MTYHLAVRKRSDRWVRPLVLSVFSLVACGDDGKLPSAAIAEAAGGSQAATQSAAAEDGADASARVPTYETFELESKLLSDFAGEPTKIVGTVLIPPGHTGSQRLPVNYVVHGFGGSHKTGATMHGSAYAKLAAEGVGGPILHVFLDANHPMGHHVFADSANTGPWGTALVEEYIPALEEEYGGAKVPWGRFVSGHSSGGWSSLWLQVEYPETFGGVWSTAPDPVDFRDFTGTDIYSFENMYENPAGEKTMLMRRRGEFVRSFESFTRKEVASQPVGGQIYSFDAVFSPKGEDGQPRFIFDRESGQIDRAVAEAWRTYDIREKLRREWAQVGPQLAGKLNIFVGTWDTFRLEGAVKLLAAELESLGSDATIVFVPERDHFDLGDPSPEHYPQGLKARVLQEMWATWEAGEAAAKTAAE